MCLCVFLSDNVCESALASHHGMMDGFWGFEQGGSACFSYLWTGRACQRVEELTTGDVAVCGAATLMTGRHSRRFVCLDKGLFSFCPRRARHCCSVVVQSDTLLAVVSSCCSTVIECQAILIVLLTLMLV